MLRGTVGAHAFVDDVQLCGSLVHALFEVLRQPFLAEGDDPGLLTRPGLSPSGKKLLYEWLRVNCAHLYRVCGRCEGLGKLLPDPFI